ncbi:uncharacterized protein LOC126628335 isoform X2 [Malus sylvestris]|uniref:uncharacterized protein LOC126628335 isoform X2 n=1 Tax=Malus sylvestris TaxID=3752 RepID=UPI0021ABE553|nr:uncharacterized protein LOC126628335 isoform X2 [Malus sylvestris]XP_050153925.1 uncharacterized protein LOC126628335 isoform X2 [Malus sylvestris]
MDGKFVRGLTFWMWLLLSMMEEWMPSSNSLSPEMLFSLVQETKVDGAIWAVESATLKAEMVLELPVYKGLSWQRDHVALGSYFDGPRCWSGITAATKITSQSLRISTRTCTQTGVDELNDGACMTECENWGSSVWVLSPSILLPTTLLSNPFQGQNSSMELAFLAMLKTYSTILFAGSRSVLFPF